MIRFLFILIFLATNFHVVAQDTLITETIDSIHYSRKLSASLQVDGAFFRYPKVSLHYAQPFKRKENLYWRTGVSFDQHRSLQPIEGVVSHSSDSLQIFRTINRSNFRFTARFGLDFVIKQRFYIGADLVAGIFTENGAIIETGQRLDTSGIWNDCIGCVYDYYGETITLPDPSSSNLAPITYQIKEGNHLYSLTGIAVNFAYQFPVSEKLELTINYSPEAIRYNYIRTKNDTQVSGPSSVPASFSQTRHYIGAAINYLF